MLHPAANRLQTVVQQLYPVSESVRPALEKMTELFRQADFWPLVLVIAVVPAVCEELAFRGFILSGFRHLGHKWRAIIYSALLFGLTHGILQQSLIASLLGVVLGYLAVQSGSILPGMVFHVCHNTLAVANSRHHLRMFRNWPLAADDCHARQRRRMRVRVAGGRGRGVAGLLLLAWFGRLPGPKSAEESLEEAIERGQHGCCRWRATKSPVHRRGCVTGK